jgi:hypothetical protein
MMTHKAPASISDGIVLYVQMAQMSLMLMNDTWGGHFWQLGMGGL